MILVAHDRWFLEAVTTATLELAGRPRRRSSRPVAHVAPREGRARTARAEGGARARPTSRASSASSSGSGTRRARPSRRRRSSPRSGGSRGALRRGDDVALLSRRTRALGFEFLKPARSGRTVIEVDDLGSPSVKRALLRGRVLRARARRARRPARAHGFGRRRCSRRDRCNRARGACGSVTPPCSDTPRSTSSSSTRAVRRWSRAVDDGACSGRGAQPLPVDSSSPAARSTRQTVGARSPVASGDDSRSHPRSRRGRTSLSSTSRRTISTSRAAKRWRPARGVPRNRAARLARSRAPRRDRRAHARHRGRRAARLRGRLRGASTREAARRAGEAPPEPKQRSGSSKPRRPKPARPTAKPPPSELEPRGGGGRGPGGDRRSA